jgi:hypothetical protein
MATGVSTLGKVAERPHEGSRGFQPTDDHRPPILPRRGATHESVSRKSSPTVNRRSATEIPPHRSPVGCSQRKSRCVGVRRETKRHAALRDGRSTPESAVGARRLALPAQSNTATGQAQVWECGGNPDSVGGDAALAVGASPGIWVFGCFVIARNFVACAKSAPPYTLLA